MVPRYNASAGRALKKVHDSEEFSSVPFFSMLSSFWCGSCLV